MSNIGGRSFNDPSDTPATEMTAPLVNANGYTQATFAQATKEIAEYIGIPFIDVYSCGINIYNTAYYLQDRLHINNTTGAKKVADCVINGLQTIQPYNN
jgi:lysophospholipase L1-like esterase